MNLHNVLRSRADELKLGLPPPDKVKNVDDMDEEHRKLLDRGARCSPYQHRPPRLVYARVRSMSSLRCRGLLTVK